MTSVNPIKRRDFLKGLLAGILFAGLRSEAFADILSPKRVHVWSPPCYDDHIKDYLCKMRHFNKNHPDDIFLKHDEYRLLQKTVSRLKRLQRVVGHGNFHLLDLNQALKFARRYSQVGRFTKSELNFLERIFYDDVSVYGFLDKKPLKNLSHSIKRREVHKIPGTGNYLFKDIAFETYQKIRRDVGETAVLTSGVRGVMKQFYLFLNKTYRSKGNLSRASRSLAPPGCSFHGVGDFDIGKAGFGIDNFTERFATTDVFKKLKDLGYINLRYPENNLLGVRFEPWHIKINDSV